MRLSFSILFILFSSLAFTQNVEFPNWLEGTWEIKTELGISYEKWEKIDNNLLYGKTYRVFADDTIVFDTMKIKIDRGEVLFEMSANVKNTRVLAGFVLSKPTPDLWKFENPITDSPHVINYWRFESDKIYVWTETMDLEDACMDFIMTRKNE